MNTQSFQPQENSSYLGTCDVNAQSCQAQNNSSYFDNYDVVTQSCLSQVTPNCLETCDVNKQQQAFTDQQLIASVSLYRKLRNMIGRDIDLQTYVNWQQRQNKLIQPRNDYQANKFNKAQNQFHQNSVPSQQTPHILAGQVTLPPHMAARRVSLPPEVPSNQVGLPSQLQVSGHVNFTPHLISSHGSYPPQLNTNQFSLPPQQAAPVVLPQQMTTNQKVFSSHSQLGEVNPSQAPQLSQDAVSQLNSFRSNNSQLNFQIPGTNPDTYQINSSKSFDSCLNGHLMKNLESCMNPQQQNNKSLGSHVNINHENNLRQFGAKSFLTDNSELTESNITPYSVSNSRPEGYFTINGNGSSQTFRSSLELNNSRALELSRNTLNMGSLPVNVAGYNTVVYSQSCQVASQGGVLQGSSYMSNIPYRNPPPYVPALKPVLNMAQPTDHTAFQVCRPCASEKTGPVSSDQHKLRKSHFKSVSPKAVSNSQVYGENLCMRKWYSMPGEAKSSENTDKQSHQDKNDTLSHYQNSSATNNDGSSFEVNSSFVNSNVDIPPYPAAHLNGNEQSVFLSSVSASCSETQNTKNALDGTYLMQSTTEPNCGRSSSHCQSISSSSSILKMSNSYEQQKRECNSNISSQMLNVLPSLIKLEPIDDDTCSSNNPGEKNLSVIDFDSRLDEASPNSSRGSKSTISPPLNDFSPISSEGRDTTNSPLLETSSTSNNGSKTSICQPPYEAICSPISNDGSKTTVSSPLCDASEGCKTTRSSPLCEVSPIFSEGSKTTNTSPSSVVQENVVLEKCVVQNTKETSAVNGVQSCESPTGGTSTNDDLPLPVIKYVPRRTPSVNETPVQHSTASKVSDGMARLRDAFIKMYSTGNAHKDLPCTQNQTEQTYGKVSKSNSKKDVEVIVKTSMKNIEGMVSKSGGAPVKRSKSETKLKKHDKLSARKSDSLLKVKLPFQQDRHRKRHHSDNTGRDNYKSSDSKRKRFHSDTGTQTSNSTKKRSLSDLDRDTSQCSNGTKKRSLSNLDRDNSRCSKGKKERFLANHALKSSKTDRNYKGHLDLKEDVEKQRPSHVLGERSHSHYNHTDKATAFHRRASFKNHLSGQHENNSFSDKQKKMSRNASSQKHTEMKGKSNGENVGKSNMSKSVERKSSYQKILPKTSSNGKSSTKMLHTNNILSKTSKSYQNLDTPKYECCSVVCDTTQFVSHAELDVVIYHGSTLIRINLPNGKYFVMKEFLAKCFTDVPRIKVYEVKVKIMKVKHCELDHPCRNDVIRYLIDVAKDCHISGITNLKNLILSKTGGVNIGPLYIGIILVSDAEKVYHYLYPVDKKTKGKNISRLSKSKDGNVQVGCEQCPDISQCSNKLTSIDDGCPVDDVSVASVCNQEVSKDLEPPENLAQHKDDTCSTMETDFMDHQDVDDENGSVSSDGTVIYCDGLPVDNTNSIETNIHENERQLSIDTCKETVDDQECVYDANTSVEFTSSEQTVKGGVELMQGAPLRYLLQGGTKWYLIEDLYSIFGEQEVLTLVQSESVVLECCTEEQCQYLKGSTSPSDDLGYYLLNEDSLHAIISSIKQTTADDSANSSNHDELGTVQSRHDEIVIDSDSEESLSSDHGNSLFKTHISSSEIPVLSRTCSTGSSDVNGLHETHESSVTFVASLVSNDASSENVVPSPRTSNDLSEMSDHSVVTCDDASISCADLSKNGVPLSDKQDVSFITCDVSSEVNKSFGCDDSSNHHVGLSVTENGLFRTENCPSVIHKDSAGSQMAILMEENDTVLSVDSDQNSILKNSSESDVSHCDRMVETEGLHSSWNNSLYHSNLQEPQIENSTIQSDNNHEKQAENNQNAFVNASSMLESNSHVVKNTSVVTLGCANEPLKMDESLGYAKEKVCGNHHNFIPDSKNELMDEPYQSLQGCDVCSKLDGMSQSVFSQNTSVSHLFESSVDDKSIVQASTINSILHKDTHATQIPREVGKEDDTEVPSEMTESLRVVSETFEGCSREVILKSVVTLCEKIFHLQNENNTLSSEVTRLTTLNIDLQDGIEHYKNMAMELAMTFKDADDD